MTLALTAPTRFDTAPTAVPAPWPVTSRLRLFRRWLRRRQLAWRFMGRDRRMLQDVSVAPAPDRPFFTNFLRR
jgi:hypothetical protein